jgi:hypothetical protein
LEKKTPPTTPQEKKKDDPSIHGTLLIGCHYFWPELSTVPRAIIPYNLFGAWLHYMRTLPFGRLVVSMTSLKVKVDN